MNCRRQLHAQGTARPRHPGRRRQSPRTTRALRTPTPRAPTTEPCWWRAPPPADCQRAAAQSRTTTPSSRCSPLSKISGAFFRQPANPGRCRWPSEPGSTEAEDVGDHPTPVRHRHQVDVPHVIDELVRHIGRHTQGQNGGLPYRSPPDGRDQSMLVERRRERAHSATRPTNGDSAEGNTATTVGAVLPPSKPERSFGATPARARRSAACSFMQQRRDVTLDGSRCDEQPGADLGVGEVLAERREHLGLHGPRSSPPWDSTAYHVNHST